MEIPIEPLIAATAKEPMSSYFARLTEAIAELHQKTPELRLRRITGLIEDDLDGIYIHKRPIIIPSSTTAQPLSLPSVGTVLHHCLVYIKHLDGVYTLDFGPADGEDVTSNLMQEVSGRKVLTGPTLLPYSDQTTLPYLYCGPVVNDLKGPLVKRAISFIDSGSYHALFRNCIHAADLLVRILSGGRVVNGPLLYDLISGDVPQVDNPLLLVFQLLMKRSWVDVCDGSKLVRELVSSDEWKSEHDGLRTANNPRPQSLDTVGEEKPITAEA